MTLLEIVQKLTSEGHLVKYRIRSDGGILITEINGTKYLGAEGNAQARTIVGAELSEARRIQLSGIKPKKGQTPKERKLLQPDEDLNKFLKKVQRAWKKNVSPEKGKITKKKLRWNIEHLGIERAREKLQQALRYAQGLAYSENIQHLVDYIYSCSNKLGGSETLNKLAEDILINSDKIREESIQPAYEALYSLNNGADVRDVANEVRKTLRI